MSLWQCPQCGTLTGPEHGPCPKCATGTELYHSPVAPFGEVIANVKQDDFRAHTCGECAWALKVSETLGDAAKGIRDRRVCRLGKGLDVSGDALWYEAVFDNFEACPAYVPREAQP